MASGDEAPLVVRSADDKDNRPCSSHRFLVLFGISTAVVIGAFWWYWRRPSPTCALDASMEEITPPDPEIWGSIQTDSFQTAVCGKDDGTGGPCQVAFLGFNVTDLGISVEDLCNQENIDHHGYFCNSKKISGCEEICRGDLLSLSDLQEYIDSILSHNPFRGHEGEQLDPWVVPHTNLSKRGAFVFMTQRMALYLSLRTLALKTRCPTKNVSSVPANALEYGFTNACILPNGRLKPACYESMFSGGVPPKGLQGNIFGLLAWSARLALENGATASEEASCYKRQQSDYTRRCSHDAVIGAVHGGKTGPETMALLDRSDIWGEQASSLHDAGTRPNVCHFDESKWVWSNSKDQMSQDDQDEDKDKYCKGHSHVPHVYQAGVGDFMSVDRPGSLAVDIAGAAYGSLPGPSAGTTASTQDESTPVFYPETVALSFNSPDRNLFLGSTSMIFLGIRRYFSGQSGSHGVGKLSHMQPPLAVFGQKCGDLGYSSVTEFPVLNKTKETKVAGISVHMFRHSLGVVTSSCGTCFGSNSPMTMSKFHTAGPTCFIEWTDHKSICSKDSAEKTDWTFWKDVWVWVGALNPDFYPSATSTAIRDLVTRVGTGPWGAGVWWGNTLQYFVITWLANTLLWRQGAEYQLDYYAYGAPGQDDMPLGGFCEQYQAQGYYDVVRNLHKIDGALESNNQNVSMRNFYDILQSCSSCDSDCTRMKWGPFPKNLIYCKDTCTDVFIECMVEGIASTQSS